MTSPDRDYTVRYRAIADFAQLIRENARARKSNREVTDEYKKGAKESEEASKKVTEAERKRAESTGETVKATRGAHRASDDYVKTMQGEERQVRQTGDAHSKIASHIGAEAKAKRDSAAANKQVSDSYDLARRSMDQTTSSLRKMGEESEKSESKFARLAKSAGSVFRRSGGSAPSVPDLSPNLSPATPSLGGRHRATEAEDTAKAIDKIGDAAPKAENRIQRMVNNTLGYLRNMKTSAHDASVSIDEIAGGENDSALRTTSLRDTSNDPVGRRRKTLGGDGGRHRILEDVEDDVGGGGGGGGSRGGGGGDDGGRSRFKVGGVGFDASKFTGIATVAAKFAVLGSAIAPIISLLGALGGAAIGAANILGSLGGVVAAAPGAFLAFATGIGAVMTAIQPLMGIMDAYKKQQAVVGVGAREQAQNQLDASNKLRDAARTHELAERSVTDSLYDAGKAQDNLNHVRRDALISLQDLRMESERGKLDQEGATLSLKRAEQEYAKAMNDPNATLLDREEALHRVKQAQIDERDSKVKNHRTQIELNDAEKRGVDLNRSVIDATRQRDLANRGVKDSQYALARSVEALTQAQKENAAGGAATYTAQQKLKDALDKASPSTRKVAEAIIGMNGAWKDTQKSVSEKLFEPIVGQLGSLKTLMPVVNDLLGTAASALGDVAARGLAMISSGPWTDDFHTLSKSNGKIIESLGDAALQVADAFRNIAVAAAPFTEWIAEAIHRMADGFADWAANARDSGAIADFLDTTKDRISQLWRIIKNIGSVFGSLYIASKPFADWFLDAVERMSERWKTWGKNAEKDGSGFRKWLEDIKPLLSTAAKFASDLTVAFFNIAKDPANIQTATDLLSVLTKDILPPLKRIIDNLGQNGVLDSIGKALGTILTVIADFLEGGGSKQLSTFVDVITGFVSILGKFLQLPGVLPVIAGITAALGGMAALRMITKLPILSHLIEGLGWLLKNKSGVGSMLSNLPGLLAGAFKNIPALVLRSIGLGALLPSGSAGGGRGTGTGTGTGGRGSRSRTSTDDDTSTTRSSRHSRSRGRGLPNLPDLPDNGPGGGGWRHKGQSPSDALYVIVVPGSSRSRSTPDVDLDTDENGRPTNRNRNTPDADNESRRTRNERGSHRAAPRSRGRLRGRGGGLIAGALTIADMGANLFGLPDVSSWFGGGDDDSTPVDPATGRPTEPGAHRAVRPPGAPESPGRLSRFGRRLGGRIKPTGNLKTLAIEAGVALGATAGEELLGSKLGKRQNDWLTAGTNIAAGASTGALIGGLVGGPLAPVTGAIGGAIGGGVAAVNEFKNNKTVKEDVTKVWNGAYEGFMNNVGSPIAKWFRDLPSHFKGISDFFTKTIPGFFGHIKDFFTKDIPNAVSGFFTVTLPKWFDNLGDFFVDLPGRIADGIGTMAADIEDFVTYQIPHFFLDTIPHWFDTVVDALSGAWEGVSDFFTHDVADFFTETIPTWFSSIGSAISGWWMDSVIPFFQEDVPNFFYVTIPNWFTSMGAAITSLWTEGVVPFFTKDVPRFFTQTIPKWFHSLVNGVKSGWKSVSHFFSVDVPNFFVHTIPIWFGKLVDGIKSGWNAVVTFFTVDVPNFFTNTIPNWFKGIGNAISEYVVQPIADFFGGAWDWIKKLLGRTGAAYEKEKAANEAKHAKGSMNGGEVPRADGGPVPGTYTGTEDQMHMRLTPGEFVVRRRQSQRPGGKEFLRAYNEGLIDPQKVLATLSVDDMTGGLKGLSSSGNLPSLVSAAPRPQSVTTTTDNSKRKTMQFGDIHMHNPVPERTSQSLRRSVQSLAFQYDDGEN